MGKTERTDKMDNLEQTILAVVQGQVSLQIPGISFDEIVTKTIGLMLSPTSTMTMSYFQ